MLVQDRQQKPGMASTPEFSSSSLRFAALGLPVWMCANFEVAYTPGTDMISRAWYGFIRLQFPKPLSEEIVHVARYQTSRNYRLPLSIGYPAKADELAQTLNPKALAPLYPKTPKLSHPIKPKFPRQGACCSATAVPTPGSPTPTVTRFCSESETPTRGPPCSSSGNMRGAVYTSRGVCMHTTLYMCV